jgi:hypothetical protein
MKKTIVIIMLFISIIAFSSEKEEKEIQDKIDGLIITFQMKAITYEGVYGFFIPLNTGYINLRNVLADYIGSLMNNSTLTNQVKALEKYSWQNFGLKVGLGVNIALNIGLLLLCVIIGIFCYDYGLRGYR